jgi:NDP-sugar pyrophosphorylase family protein
MPCAGKSTRFPNMKPKWMLTHPDGKLMVEKAMEGLPLEKFNRIIITIVKEHAVKYQGRLILEQALNLAKNKKIEILELDDFTSCQAETIYQTLVKKKVKGAFVANDSDNHVKIKNFPGVEFVAGLDINKSDKEIYRLKSKSFLIVNDQNIIVDIVEKQIRSENICLGVYGFSDPKKFIAAYKFLASNGKAKNEIYLSHIISYLIGTGKSVYSYVEAGEFEDWGTLQDWKNAQTRHTTYFIDIDGVLLENRGKYGKENWSNCLPAIEENLKTVKKLQDGGAQMVFTTCRSEGDLAGVKKLLKDHGIKAHSFVINCYHSPRVIINDFAPTNPYPSCLAINIPRNGLISDYL